MPEYNQVRGINSTYVPQYVGSNYDELKSIASELDERYRQNKDLSDKIAVAAAQEQYLDTDEDIKKELQDRITGQIDTIASSPENFENSSALVSQLARDFMADPKRIVALENKRRVDADRALLEKYGPRGYNFGQDDINKFRTVDEEGNIRKYRGQVEELMDYDARKETLFDNLTADAAGGVLKPTDLAGFMKTTDWTGISNEKVKGYLNSAFDRYKKTTEYDQEKRKYLKENPDLSAEVIDSAIKNNLLAVGKEKVFGRTDATRQQDPVALMRMKAAMDEDTQRILTTAKTGIVPNTLLAPTPLDNMAFSDGKAVKRIQGESVRGIIGGSGLLMGTQSTNTINKTEALAPNDPAYQYLDNFMNQQKIFGNDLSNLSQEEVVNRFNNAREDLKKVSYVMANPSLDVKNAIKAEVIGEAGGGLAGKQVFLMDGGDIKQGGDLNTVAQGLGYKGADDERFDKALRETEDFTIQPYNPFSDALAGGYSAGIRTASGEFKRILISPSQDQAQYFQRSQALGKAALTGEPIVGYTEGEQLQLEDGRSYIIYYDAVPVLTDKTTQNGKKGKFDLNIQRYAVEPNTGKVVNLPADSQGTRFNLTLQEIADMDTQDFAQSGYLGSRLSATKPSSVQ